MKILETLLQLAPIVFEWLGKLLLEVQGGKLSPEELYAKVEQVLGDTEDRRARLRAILVSDELQAAYDAFKAAIGPEVE